MKHQQDAQMQRHKYSTPIHFT